MRGARGLFLWEFAILIALLAVGIAIAQAAVRSQIQADRVGKLAYYSERVGLRVQDVLDDWVGAGQYPADVAEAVRLTFRAQGWTEVSPDSWTLEVGPLRLSASATFGTETPPQEAHVLFSAPIPEGRIERTVFVRPGPEQGTNPAYNVTFDPISVVSP